MFTLTGAAQGQEDAIDPVHFKDWTVQCAVKEGNKLCIMKQVLNMKDQDGTLLRIELSKGSTGGMSGLIVVPFGLDITKGISMTIDGGPRWNLPYRTCQAFGCIIPINISSQVVDKLKQSNALTIYLYTLSGSSNLELPVSLSGFTSAFNAF